MTRIKPFSALSLRIILPLLLGLLLSLLFFIWVERNCSLPYLPLELGWPWIALEAENTWWLCLWNAMLFFLFGLIHSALAQPLIHRLIFSKLSPQTIRITYILITGISLLFVMGFWQNTGTLIWVLPVDIFTLNLLSVFLFWGFSMAASWALTRLNWKEFIGLAAPRPISENTALMISGIYGHVRHPAYFFTLAAFWITPWMSLDRLTLSVALTIYLIFAIPVEEKKLLKKYGNAYQNYQQQVPALFPRF